jgi:hypothetical protein
MLQAIIRSIIFEFGIADRCSGDRRYTDRRLFRAAIAVEFSNDRRFLRRTFHQLRQI